MSARTVYAALLETAALRGAAPALHQPIPGAGFQVYSWEEYRRTVEEIAAGLRSLGIARGDIVGLASDARAEFYFADVAVMANGSIAAALYPNSPPPEQARALAACDARAVFVESPAVLGPLLAEPHLPKGIISILLTGEDERGISLEALRARGREALSADPGLTARLLSEVTGSDHAILYLTSGATGEPKMGLVTHGAVMANVAMGPHVLDMGEDDAILAFLPPAHVMQRLVVELLPIYCGVPVWFAESLLRLPQEFARVRPTIFVAPPRLYERIHATVRAEIRKRGRATGAAFELALRLGSESVRLSRQGRRMLLPKRILLAAFDTLFFRKIRGRFGGRLRIAACGSAPLGRELGEFFLAAGLPLIEGFGLTEGGVVIINPSGRMKPGSIGKPLPGVEVRLASDGEMLVSSATLFSEYYKDPAATAEVLRDGWLHTGDLAEFDSDGYLYITGRKKEVIVASNGRKIFPSRIESLFRLEPVVSNVVLAGEGLPYLTALLTVNTEIAGALPGMDRFRGLPPAEVIQAPPVIRALRAAVDRVNSKLAPFEQVRRYQVLDRDFSILAGELTATLKVRRMRALENFRESVASLYADHRESAPSAAPGIAP